MDAEEEEVEEHHFLEEADAPEEEAEPAEEVLADQITLLLAVPPVTGVPELLSRE